MNRLREVNHFLRVIPLVSGGTGIHTQVAYGIICALTCSFLLPCAAGRHSSPRPSTEAKKNLIPGAFTLPSAKWVELSGAGNRVRFSLELESGCWVPLLG